MDQVKLGRISDFSSDNIHLNLAAEEAILRQFPFTGFYMTVRVWTNPRSVILGRGQRVEEEVNQGYCLEHNIEVGRRMTGGGAVYHDDGNLNVSLFMPRDALHDQRVLNVCSTLCDIFVESMRKTGVSRVTREGTNIINKGRKVSGAASYFKRAHFLYHSTLLHSANLEHLEKSLVQHPAPLKRNSKSMPTKNLVELQIDQWQDNLIDVLRERFDIKFEHTPLTNEELRLAEILKESKYSQKSWIIDGNQVRGAQD